MSWQTQSFNYQDGEQIVRLEARVPVWTCGECGEQYTDEIAEELRHEAVCAYLGRLTPKEIKALREGYEMSQAEWAETSRLGIASIKRWETGSLIQGAAQDAYLRLLAYPSNLEIARGFGARSTVPGTFHFRTEFSTETLAKARVFQLRKRA